MSRGKTRAQVVISNYNADPTALRRWDAEEVIYDQSDDPAFIELLTATCPNVIRRPNTGHSLTVFMEHLASIHQDPPDVVTLAKGNLIGRHVSASYFERVQRNEHYTFLYEDASYRGVPGVSSLLFEGGFLERNDNWYVDSKPHRYFSRLDQVLDFLFVDPVHPEWVLFSPGGCYIVPRANIVKNPPGLYEALRFISSYEFFPAEAYFVERLMHTVFTANYRLQPYVLDFDLCRAELESLPDRSADRAPRRGARERVRRWLS